MPYEANPFGDPIITARNLAAYHRSEDAMRDENLGPVANPDGTPTQLTRDMLARIGRDAEAFAREASALIDEHRDTNLHAGDTYIDGCPTCDPEGFGEAAISRYPWRLDEATARGWDRAAHVAALQTGDVDAIALTHPANWLSEDEIERRIEPHCGLAGMLAYQAEQRALHPNCGPLLVCDCTADDPDPDCECDCHDYGVLPRTSEGSQR